MAKPHAAPYTRRPRSSSARPLASECRSFRTRPPVQHPRCRVARPESIRGGGRSRRRCGTRSPRQSKHPRRRRSLSDPAGRTSPRRRRSSSRQRTPRIAIASTHSSSRRCPSRIVDRRGPARRIFSPPRVGCSQPCVVTSSNVSMREHVIVVRLVVGGAQHCTSHTT